MKTDVVSLAQQVTLLKSVVSLLVHTHPNQELLKQLLPVINEKMGPALVDPISDLWPELSENFNLDD